ncbi:MAG: response regulator transcription factor [Flavobacteriaceae bacterium]|mgnify:FL=1|tara:strand:- start:2000 stop:2677 length:678 start_codon:yes stop_codon:yes gene_type:complete
MNAKTFKILLVDDEPDILEILSYPLKNEGFQVYTANNGLEAIKFAKDIQPDLIVLDVMMPEMDGIEACEIIRKDSTISNTLITFLSARGEDYSKIAGFNAGADDYITKPIKPKVLVSKVKSLLRRISLKKSDLIETKNLIIDRSGYKVIENNKDIFLPRKEFELLFLLASEPGKVFKRNLILDSVWGKDVVVGDRTIDVHVRKLREKIGDHYFKTVKGVGYKLVD